VSLELLRALTAILMTFFCRKYADTIPRQFGVRYNAYTQSIEVLDSKPQLDNLMGNINLEMHILQNALKKL
jgi:phenylalanine-4-hydroxylase